MIENMLGKKGEPLKARAIVYKAVVQVVIMYGIENLVVTDAMMTVLEGLHHRM